MEAEEIKIDELKKFLVKAKRNTYAGKGKEIKSERLGFKELEYKEGDFYYRDSYIGFFQAPGQEIVRFKEKPIWTMAYSGGMLLEYQRDVEFARIIFDFLKKALILIPIEDPYRGPKVLKQGDFEYINEVKGNIKNFKGHEKILFEGRIVFEQDYIGGLIIDK